MSDNKYVVNEQGHTSYPKWVYPEGKKPVIVQSPEEENEVLGIVPTVQATVVPQAKSKKPATWP